MVHRTVSDAALSGSASYRQRSSSLAPLLPETHDLRAIVTKVFVHYRAAFTGNEHPQQTERSLRAG
jgi:hypothetical protein